MSKSNRAGKPKRATVKVRKGGVDIATDRPLHITGCHFDNQTHVRLDASAMGAFEAVARAIEANAVAAQKLADALGKPEKASLSVVPMLNLQGEGMS